MIGPVMKAESCASMAGQGSRVKRAEARRPGISGYDQAEADYLKGLADYENARRLISRRVKPRAGPYLRRTKFLYEKTITAEKISRCRTRSGSSESVGENSVNGTKRCSPLPVALADTGLKDSTIDSLANKPDLQRFSRLTLDRRKPSSSAMPLSELTVGRMQTFSK